VEKSRVNGEYMHGKLKAFYDHPSVGDIRGSGLFAGIEFVKDKKTKEPFSPEIKFNTRVVDKCFDNGLLLYPGPGTIDGVRGDHLIIAPPLVASKDEIDEMLEILEKSLTEVEKET
jgi:adenosylmethionine-8-amino-7-oxononanoate aminotransferase